VSVEPGDAYPPGLPQPRSRHLLPYERRLVAWQLRRMRAGRRYDVAKTEHDNGPEYVRLYAAYAIDMRLMTVVFVIGLVPTIILGGLYGMGGFFAGLGVIGFGGVIGAIGLVRMFQSDNARKEYQQAQRLTPQ
jgi:hypothetical protein